MSGESALPDAEVSIGPNLEFGVYLFEGRQRANRHVHEYVQTINPDFRPRFAHALEGSGKRMRAILSYITADAYGFDGPAVDKFAVVMEVVHGASLIEDDWRDDSKERHHRPALYVAFGEKPAILTGFALGFDLFRPIAELDAQAGLNGTLTHYVAETLGPDGMCLGQDRDSGHAQKSETHSIFLRPTEEDLDETSYRKTGLAIELAIVGTAMIGGVPDDHITTLKAFAKHCGIAYQIKDDLLDGEGGGPDVTGKDGDQDHKNGKANYVSRLGAQNAKAKLAWHLEQATEIIDTLSPIIDTGNFKAMVQFMGHRPK